MELMAYITGGIALAVALWLAFSGYGSRRDRAIRFAIPSPLYVAAPFCGLVIRHNQEMAVVLGLAKMATVLAVLALLALFVLVWASTRTWRPDEVGDGA